MRMKEYRRVMALFATSLCRWPWIVAAVAIALKLFRLVIWSVLFGNLCPSDMNFMPELSAETIVRLDGLYGMSLRATAIVTVCLLVLPLVPLCFGRLKTVWMMLIWALPCILFDPIAWLPDWEVKGPILDEIRAAKSSIACLERLKDLGVSDNGGFYVIKMEQRKWVFGGGKFVISKSGNSRPDANYNLINVKWRPSKYGKDLWDNRVLLDEVVGWKDCGDSLIVVTADGHRYALDYEYGKLSLCDREDGK